MIITPHLLVGAAIGAKTHNLGLIIILGLLSHLILDKIPHWDYGKRIEKLSGKKIYDKNLLIEFVKMGIDGLLGLIIVATIIWQKDMIRQPADLNYLLFILVGVSVSLLPDFSLGIVKLLSYFNKFKKFTKKYLDFHEETLHCPLHIKKPTLLGLGTGILISIIAVLILLL